MFTIYKCIRVHKLVSYTCLKTLPLPLFRAFFRGRTLDYLGIIADSGREPHTNRMNICIYIHIYKCTGLYKNDICVVAFPQIPQGHGKRFQVSVF